MAGLDKEETITMANALRDMFLRAGSTRGLLTISLNLFLGWCSWVDKSNVPAYAAMGAFHALWTLLSFHRKPHVDRAPTASPPAGAAG